MLSLSNKTRLSYEESAAYMAVGRGFRIRGSHGPEHRPRRTRSRTQNPDVARQPPARTGPDDLHRVFPFDESRVQNLARTPEGNHGQIGYQTARDHRDEGGPRENSPATAPLPLGTDLRGPQRRKEFHGVRRQLPAVRRADRRQEPHPLDGQFPANQRKTDRTINTLTHHVVHQDRPLRKRVRRHASRHSPQRHARR